MQTRAIKAWGARGREGGWERERERERGREKRRSKSSKAWGVVLGISAMTT
jgi:hypothetical protein